MNKWMIAVEWMRIMLHDLRSNISIVIYTTIDIVTLGLAPISFLCSLFYVVFVKIGIVRHPIPIVWFLVWTITSAALPFAMFQFDDYNSYYNVTRRLAINNLKNNNNDAEPE